MKVRVHIVDVGGQQAAPALSTAQPPAHVSGSMYLTVSDASRSGANQ